MARALRKRSMAPARWLRTASRNPISSSRAAEGLESCSTCSSRASAPAASPLAFRASTSARQPGADAVRVCAAPAETPAAAPVAAMIRRKRAGRKGEASVHSRGLAWRTIRCSVAIGVWRPQARRRKIPFWQISHTTRRTTPGVNCSSMNLRFSGPSGMNWRKICVATILALNVCTTLTAVAHAAEPVKQTQFSTNGPVEVPGMMLDGGQYVFKLIEPEAQRNVLQVFETVQLWTGDGTRLLSTMLTMPNYDLPPTDKTVFTFFERGSQQPKALRIWFAPGRNYGQELVYPKAQAAELAKSVGRSVLSLPAELPGDIGQLARMVAEPTGPATKAPVASPVSEPSPAAPVNAVPAASTA